MTTYVVLQKVGVPEKGPGHDAYIRLGVPVDAVSAEAAIRKNLGNRTDGTFVAIPLRSFVEQAISDVETKTTVKFA